MDNNQSTYMRAGLARLEDLSNRGIRAYPHKFHRTHSTQQIKEEYCTTVTEEPTDDRVRVAGRVMAMRGQGAIIFMDLEDQSGRIQMCIRRDVSDEFHRLVKSYVTLGSIVGVSGGVFRTRTNELTILADSVELLSHSLHPLPDKRRGLRDIGTARDARYVELIADAAARERFLTRSRIIRLLREFLNGRDFVEVETPVLDSAYGGAEARPFLTHLNALDRELYLRISPELNLKRLTVGGLERIYEIGKQFRNEGIDATHHPEFTSVEVYEAYADYNDMMDLTETIISHLATEVTGSTQLEITRRDGAATIDLQPPYDRVTFFGAIERYTGYDLENATGEETRRTADVLGVASWDNQSRDEIARDIFDALVEDHLVQPTFVVDYPASLCPLTKRHRIHEHLAERFELFISGSEFANAYSELNDPREQRAHFERQDHNRRVRGDRLAHMADWDYVRALEFGMPPAGGLGIGIDRLVMLLTGARHIQDIILFPVRRY